MGDILEELSFAILGQLSIENESFPILHREFWEQDEWTLTELATL